MKKPKTHQDLELEMRDVIGNVPLDFLRNSVENMEVKFIKR